jgi:type II secretory pathway pseudopilin PulG
VTLSALITFLLSHLEFVVIGLVVLSTIFNFISGTGKSLREAQKRAEQEAELRRRGSQAQLEAREANPNTQSYEGYLRRTSQNPTAAQPAPAPTMQPRPTPPKYDSNNPQELKDLQAEIFQALGMKGTGSNGQSDSQAELRRAMDQKMGRATTPATPPRPVPPRSTPRPAPRAPSKPIESQIEIYLDNSRPERLENDSVPDTFGHSKRQPHFDRPRSDPRNEGSVAFKGEGGVADIVRPDAVNEVRGIGVARTGPASLAVRLVDPRNAAQGVIWSEILGKPRSRR